MKHENKLTYHLTLRLFLQEKSFGPGPMRLLEGVKKTGSLQKAAAEMGGGSSLTEDAEELLSRYEAMLSEVTQAAEGAFKKYFPQ